ncbi:MAG: MoxR family ATPase [Bacteroidota bacterium]|nr:MoxR family ATPase [Bacteroidota bacterium]
MTQIKDSGEDYYKPGTELLAAINTALLLKRPLLLAGEPGTGKTDCAEYIARELNRAQSKRFRSDRALRFNIKSVSQSTDLFYYYDAVSHFGDKTGKEKEHFISFNALGLALLRTLPVDESLSRFRNYQKEVAAINPPYGSVVLLDEIDKAPRDFPNDLLAELEKPPFKFSIRELSDLEFKQSTEDIVVVITSNNEKGLPDAFLRRCIFHYIDFPSPTRLREIVASKPIYTEMNGGEKKGLENAIAAFLLLRDNEALNKRPATSELIDWIVCLKEKQLLEVVTGDLKDIDPAYRDILRETVGVLGKSRSDNEILSRKISG